MQYGYIALWRKFLDTSFFKDSYAVHIALYLLLKATHKETTFTFNGKEETLNPGQVLTGRIAISKDTRVKQGTTYKKLKLLENIGFCNIKSNNKFSVITILNYEDYQNTKQQREQEKEQQRNNNVTTKEQQRNTYNKDNKEKKDNNDNNTILQIKNLRGRFLESLLPKVDSFLKVVANKNKSKKITLSRKKTLLLEILNSMRRCDDDSIFEYALDETIKREIATVGYIAAIMEKQKDSETIMILPDYLEKKVVEFCRVKGINYNRGIYEKDNIFEIQDFISRIMKQDRIKTKKKEEIDSMKTENILNTVLGKLVVVTDNEKVSPIEKFLSNALINAKLDKYFKFQYPIGTKRVDFACPEAMLVVECDGKEYHFTDKLQIGKGSEKR